MSRLERDLDLANAPDLRLVTFTMDPAFDTPEVLRRYARQTARTESDRWLFLTGPEDELQRFIKTGLRIAIEKNAKPEPGQEYNHGTWLIVVDKQGRARGHFNGFPGEHDADGRQYEDSLAQLKLTVATLLKE
jgi:protein SCO1/2